MIPEKRTCLIADDSRVVRKVLGRIVTDFGFSFIEAEDGLKALNACTASMPDCIMLDWTMPVMDGLEFLGRLRALENGSNPKVIMCSTKSAAAQIQRAMNSGADEYVIKPFDHTIIRRKFLQLGLLKNGLLS